MPAKTKEETIQMIGELIKAGKTNPEIAEVVGKSRASVSLLAGRYFGGNPNYLRRKTRHKHLRGDVLAFFLAHTAAETMEHFGLTSSGFKSCLTVAYMDPAFKYLRKDTRNHNPWTIEEILTTLKYSGILRRSRIGEIIKRGSDRVIKEKLRALNVSTRNINGVNISQFRRLFGFEPKYQIRGEAGPGSTKTNRFVIIPWGYVVECYRVMSHDKTMLRIFEVYSKFHKFIWKGDPWRQMMKDKRVNKYLYIVEQGAKS